MVLEGKKYKVGGGGGGGKQAFIVYTFKGVGEGDGKVN